MKISWEWIAGFFDGEGSIGVYTNNARACGMTTASVSQAGDRGEKVLKEIQEFLTQRGIKSYLGCKKNVRIKDVWALRILARSSLDPFLRGILPYLRVKKLEAQDVLRFIIAFPPVSQGTYFKELNEERKQSGWYKKKTHCPQGHPYDAVNTGIISTTGARRCKACCRAKQVSLRLARKAG